MRQAWLIGIVFGAWAAAWAQESKMSHDVEAALKPIAEFQKTQNVDLLERVAGQLRAISPLEVPGTGERLVVRRKTAAGWLLLIHTIDAAKDPKFDPNDRPVTRVMIPGNTSPGGPPRDPGKRAEYDNAVKANDLKAVRTQLQWRLKAADLEACGGARLFFRQYFTSSPADQKELQQLREKAAISEARWKEVMAPAPSVH